MFKKYLIYFNLTIISFIAGTLFIIQCGQQVQALADALGIDYDNSSSNLSATTVQGAIDELSQRLPFVFDSEENVIGIFLDKYTNGWSVWSFEHQAVFPLDPVTGKVIQDDSQKVHFSEADCTGTAYLFVQEDDSEGATETAVRTVGGTYYFPNFRGHIVRKEYSAITEIQSTLEENVSSGTTRCTAFTGSGNEDFGMGSSSSDSVSTLSEVPSEAQEVEEVEEGEEGEEPGETGENALVKSIMENEIDQETYVEARTIDFSSFSGPLYLGTNLE